MNPLSLIRSCPTCNGEGEIDRELYPSGGQVIASDVCPDCLGNGFLEIILPSLATKQAA